MITIGLIANKGGQGKTATAINLAHGLALQGRKVLLIDCDDQGHVAVAFEANTKDRMTLYHLLAREDIQARDVIVRLRDNLSAILSDETLYAGLVALQNIPDDVQRASRLRRIVQELESEGFDYIIFDGKPGQNDLVYNIIMAANYLYIPVDVSGSDFFGLAGLGSFIEAIQSTCEDFADDVGHWFDRILLIPYFFKSGQRDSQQDCEALATRFPGLVAPPIRYSQAVANAPRHGQTIFEYPTIGRNNGIEDFTKLVELTVTYEKNHVHEDAHV